MHLLLLRLLDTAAAAWNPRHFSATKTPDRQRGAAVLFERRHQGSGLSFGVLLLNGTQADKLQDFGIKYQLIQNAERQLGPPLLYHAVHGIDFWNDAPCMLIRGCGGPAVVPRRRWLKKANGKNQDEGEQD